MHYLLVKKISVLRMGPLWPRPRIARSAGSVVTPLTADITLLCHKVQWPFYTLVMLTADPVQARCHSVQSATLTCTKLPRATCPRRWCVWLASTALRWHESHPGTASHIHLHRQSSFPGRRSTNLKFPSRRRYLRWVAVNLPKKAVKTSVLSIVSWLLLLSFTPAVDLAVAVPLRPL